MKYRKFNRNNPIPESLKKEVIAFWIKNNCFEKEVAKEFNISFCSVRKILNEYLRTPDKNQYLKKRGQKN